MIITIKFDCYNQNLGKQKKKKSVYVEREQTSQRKLQILESKPHIKLRKSINPTFRSKHFSAKELRSEPVHTSTDSIYTSIHDYVFVKLMILIKVYCPK